MKSDGLTLIELLVVMAIIAVAFTVLATGAISNLRGTATSRAQTQVKGVAVAEMERVANFALYVDSTKTAPSDKYAFLWYYNNCVGSTLPARCQGSDTGKGTSWKIVSESNDTATGAAKYMAEGQLLIQVSATNSTGSSYAITKRISCYDVYPAPKTTAPDPCPPVPTLPTGGVL